MIYDVNKVKEGRDKTRKVWDAFLPGSPFGKVVGGGKFRRLQKLMDKAFTKAFDYGRPGWSADILDVLIGELSCIYADLRTIEKEYEIY